MKKLLFILLLLPSTAFAADLQKIFEYHDQQALRQSQTRLNNQTAQAIAQGNSQVIIVTPQGNQQPVARQNTQPIYVPPQGDPVFVTPKTDQTNTEDMNVIQRYIAGE